MRNKLKYESPSLEVILPDVSCMYPNAILNNIKDKTGLGIGIILPEEEDK